MNVELSTSADAKAAVNGVGFLVQGIARFRLSDATFPSPAHPLPEAFLSPNHYKTTTADYSAPAVVLEDGSKTSSCVLFVDEVEKWTTGSWYKETGDLCVGFSPLWRAI